MKEELKSTRNNTKCKRERDLNPDLDKVVCILSESLNNLDKRNYERNINLNVILYDTVKNELEAFKILNSINTINFKNINDWREFREKEKVVKDFLGWYSGKMQIEWADILSSGFMNVIDEISNEISKQGVLKNEIEKMDFIEKIFEKDILKSNKIYFENYKKSI